MFQTFSIPCLQLSMFLDATCIRGLVSFLDNTPDDIARPIIMAAICSLFGRHPLGVAD